MSQYGQTFKDDLELQARNHMLYLQEKNGNPFDTRLDEIKSKSKSK